MSYWVYVEEEVDESEPWSGNMTSNVRGMWDLALESTGGPEFRGLHEMPCREAIPHLTRAVVHIRHPDNWDTYKAMNPPNGWGDHDGAARFLEEILAACREAPEGRLRLSY